VTKIKQHEKRFFTSVVRVTMYEAVIDLVVMRCVNLGFTCSLIQFSSSISFSRWVIVNYLQLCAGSVFISYNHGSRPTVFKVRDRLRAAGYIVWIDEDEMCA